MSGGRTHADTRADRVAARATGAGVGLLTFMIVWILGSQIATRLWGPPSGALVAMGIAILAGVVMTIETCRRLTRTQLREVERS